MITIMDIAKMANVSRTTVSRVINNTGYVSDEVRKRVLKVIEETGYTPSHQAKSLRTKKTKVIGVVLPRISTETSSKVVMGLDDVFSRDGYQILLANTNLNVEKEIEFLKLLINRQVDGIVLVATNLQPELVDTVQTLPVPVVAIGQNIPGISTVIYNDYDAAATVTELFIERGRKKIAYIGVPETDPAVGVLRKQGYLDTLKKYRLPVKEEWIQTGSFETECGYEGMKRIIESSAEKPNGLFAATDRIAIGALTYLKVNRYRIPEDICIAGVGASEIAKYVTPSLTTVDYENEIAGQKAAELLLEHIKREKMEPKKIVLNYRLIKRDSL